MAGRTLTIDIQTKDAQTIAALKKLQREFKDLDKQVDKTDKTARGLNLGDAVGGLAIGAGLAFATNEFEEAEATARKTQAVIESTGNAAQVSAEQQGEFVDELSKMAGVDDDVVAAGTNILRTFTKIKGDALEGATEAALNMSAAMGTDLQAASLQVGKALNDPIKGITSLSRAGIQFSEDQKQMIRSLVETGDVAGAQAIILKELEVQFGGQAEAAATASGRAKVAFGEMAESVGGILAPAVEAGSEALGAMASAFDELPGPIQTAVIGLAGIAAVSKRYEDQLGRLSDGVQGFGGDLSKLDKALIGGAGFIGSYTLAMEGLQKLTDSGLNLDQVEEDLLNFGAGVSDALTFDDLDIEGLAKKFELLDESLGTRLRSGDVLGSRYGEAANTVNELDDALASLVDSGNAKAAETAYTAIVEGLADQGLAYDEIVPKFGDYLAAQDRAEAAAKRGKIATDEQSDSLDEEAAAAAGWLGPIKDRTDARLEEEAALKGINEQLSEQQARAGDAFDAQAAYQSSIFGVEDAERALQEAYKSGDPDEVERAQQRLYEAVVRQSEAKVTLAEKEAEVAGKTLTAAEAAGIQRGALESLQEQTGVTNDSLQTLIDRLVLAEATYKISIDQTDLDDTLDKTKLLIALQAQQRATDSFNAGSLPNVDSLIPPGLRNARSADGAAGSSIVRRTRRR